MITEAFAALEPVVGIKPACELTGRSRATVYRQRHPKPRVAGPRRAPAAHPAALSELEQERVLSVLRSQRFVDKSPAFPLGRWLSDQRRAYRAGTMCSTRADELEELGMVWDTADTAFAENLAAARAYYAQAGTLAAPRHATALDKPVGQWLTNLRRPDGLGKDPERAARRAEQLAAIDPDWNPGQLGWTVDWQRHYTGLTTLLEGGAGLDDIVPGVTHHRRPALGFGEPGTAAPRALPVTVVRGTA
ncbi:helicase associated domain-containing protein [Streptomyces sp. NBC_00841]|uniref:helicase associated domain-containing protein n=1 Tax=Streptomyces sp. NBC_00841 TaxID=2975847 RepID=UPI002DDB688A|nr:helicase associated domain-containing protein [Streptomyces sp. NBC_00841]